MDSIQVYQHMPRIDIVFCSFMLPAYYRFKLRLWHLAGYDRDRLIHRQAPSVNVSPSKCKLARRNKAKQACSKMHLSTVLDLYWSWIKQQVSCISRGGRELRSREDHRLAFCNAPKIQHTIHLQVGIRWSNIQFGSKVCFFLQSLLNASGTNKCSSSSLLNCFANAF